MMKLIAMRPVLYAGRTYERGDALPAHDTKMVEAWLRAGSAAWDGQKTRQDGGNGQGGQEPGGGEKSGQDGQKAPEGGKNEQRGGEPDMVTGHLDQKQLERMSKADLLDLAEKLGVDISAAKNQAERAQLIAAVEVQPCANDPENDGGAQ